MKNMLIEIFKPTPIELTLEELEKKLYGRIIAGKTKENILNDLKLLELEGKIFYDARNNTYKTFPSNFFITKVTSVKDNEFYFKINTKEYNLPNKNSLKKKDTIILEKVHNRFKFIKAIQNIEQEKSNDNKYILTVPIAHVSHYIPYNSPLWIRASKNTTSLYLANHVLHMLHPIISNGICSLNPNVERLAKTYRMTINENGYVENLEIFDSVIKSKKKMTYEDINQIFYENTVPEGYEPFLKDLSLLQELSHIIENRRIKNGSLEFDSKEIEFLETEDSLNLSAKTQKEAEKIIANCMIITNEAIADYTLNLCLISIYRNHEIPMDEKLRVTLKLIKSIGYKIECLKDTTDPHVLQKIINSLSTKEEFFILSSLLLRSMQKAYYSTNNAGHYGLALDGYSQVTSPIRRFMDLIIEYILDNIEIMLDPSFDVENFKNELEEYAKRASIMERCADKAEYEANKLYMVKYVKEHFDETFEGFIQDITPRGLIIKTKELIEGIIFFEDLDDGLYTYNKECRWLEYKNNNKKIMIGSKILLTPKELDEEFRVIYFNGNSNTLIKKQKLTRKKD